MLQRPEGRHVGHNYCKVLQIDLIFWCQLKYLSLFKSRMNQDPLAEELVSKWKWCVPNGGKYTKVNQKEKVEYIPFYTIPA